MGNEYRNATSRRLWDGSKHSPSRYKSTICLVGSSWYLDSNRWWRLATVTTAGHKRYIELEYCSLESGEGGWERLDSLFEANLKLSWRLQITDSDIFEYDGKLVKCIRAKLTNSSSATRNAAEFGKRLETSIWVAWVEETSPHGLLESDRVARAVGSGEEQRSVERNLFETTQLLKLYLVCDKTVKENPTP